MADTSSASLRDLLADALPQAASFTYYHISTPPTKCSPIFSAPPGARPERTYCESHFLTVSVTPDDEQACRDRKAAGEILVFAIEVLIYSTSYLTTIFVSKADSTGYLSLLQLPRTSSSPIRAVSTTFVSWLVRHRQRPASRLVVSLFARAQDQYLFPGSIENPDKHVADDTALVKWWCRVLDPVLRAYTAEASGTTTTENAAAKAQTTAQGHLIIPGFERNETMRFFPPSVRADPPEHKRWKHGHPLLEISRHPAAPPRCLIPHFPDDPKARYMDELDDELPDGGNASVTSPSRGTGQWRSVRSLAQFWEMMSFRQECSSGRLVGFIWVVFTPAGVVDGASEGSSAEDTAGATAAASAAADGSAALSPPDGGGQQPATTTTNSLAEMLAQPLTTPPSTKKATQSPSHRSPRRRRRTPSKLTGPIVPRVPRIKSSSSQTSSSTTNPENSTSSTSASASGTSSSASSTSMPESSPYYVWPPHARGALVLGDKDYRRATDLLLHHNFAERAIAIVSTRRWVDEVAVLGGMKGGGTRKGAAAGWGVGVVGRAGGGGGGAAVGAGSGVGSAEGVARNGGGGGGGAGAVNVLSTSMVRKKRKGGEEAGGAVSQPVPSERSGEAAAATAAGVNVLSAGLVRKKPKTEDAPQQDAGKSAEAAAAGEQVNVLSAGLVRKKPKA